ncbi:hydrogenase maturation nickel metallochaperone HypA [Mycobacterium lehmannii]|uniref:hydrogenase maturation nickel metallochaperone HypA n=1 Tax=Mycobacterium lehmannii TaxID=2048550 RepID=UPI001E5F3182|nr:hydrogenase maturation nickel metallochaperone HypA [Mycobacterium lehmannii]
MTDHAGHGAVRIVNVRIGAMRQIVPDTLVYCWSLVTEGSDLHGAQLHVEQVPATIRCRACGHEHVLDAPIMLCPACESANVALVSGDEFLITSLELEKV